MFKIADGIERMTKFSYEGAPPAEYVCGECKANGVRLYRDYQTCADSTRLLCTACAEKAGKQKANPEHPDSIGWMVAAVPTEDGDTFWGFSSVPWRGVYWWRSLPTVAGQPQPAEHLRSWLCQQVANTTWLVESYAKSLGEARASERALTEQLAQKDARIKALADALEETAPRMSPTYGPCWCPASVKNIPHVEVDHGVLCVRWRAALRLVGRLP